jgi:hypothetical protein
MIWPLGYFGGIIAAIAAFLTGHWIVGIACLVVAFLSLVWDGWRCKRQEVARRCGRTGA